jgi:hypothetical protein
MGSVAHRVLERLRFGGDREGGVVAVTRLVESLGAAAGLGADQRAMIARDFVRYIQTVASGEQVVGRELPFMLNPAPGLFVRGQIDLLLGDAAGLTVRDYKYSRRAEARRYAIQLECYALAVATAIPGAAIAAEIVTLRDRPETVALRLPGADEIRERLASLGIAIRASMAKRDYPKKPPNEAACRELGCGYVGRCWK